MQNNIARKLAQLPADHLIVGVDPHKRMHAVTVMTQQACICTKFKIKNSREGFERLLTVAQAEASKVGAAGVIFAIEAGGHYWRNLSYYLHGKGFDFRLINPFTLKRQREGEDLNQRKNDYRDATAAAELLRTGKFTETRLLEGDYAELRAVHQAYQRLNKEYTRNINLCKGLLDGLFPEFCEVIKDPCGKTAMAVISACPIPALIVSQTLEQFVSTVRDAYEGGRLSIKKLRALHEVASATVGIEAGAQGVAVELEMLVRRQRLLAEQMWQLERKLFDLIEKFEEFRYVGSVTGLGVLTVAGMVAEIGPLEHYGNAKDLVKLAGVNPTQRESAEKAQKHTPMSKKGRPVLRCCLWQAALGLLRSNEEFRIWAKGLQGRASRANPLRQGEVLGAAMNKLLRLYFALVSKRQMYRPIKATEVLVAA